MKPRFILLLAFAFFLLGSCKKTEEINFTFYLEYTDSALSCKTCKLMIDGQENYSAQICFEGYSPNFKIYSLNIKSGSHRIKAEILEDSKIFEQTIEINDSNKFGYLTYHNSSSEFTFFLNSTGGID